MDRNRINAHPSMPQKLLLRAAFLNGPQAVTAWRQWKNTIDMQDHLDIGSLRLLAPLHRNLRTHGIDDSMMSIFKGVTRQTWVKNHRYFERFQPLFESFERLKIDVIMLGKAAMALRCALAYPLENSSEIVLHVRPRDIAKVVGQLKALGWRAIPWFHPALLEEYFDAAHSHMFSDDAGNQLVLQWRLILSNFGTSPDNGIWSRSLPFEGDALGLRMLSPTDHLIWICLGPASLPPIPLFNRLIDAMVIIHGKGTEIDWQYVVDAADQYGYAGYLRATLTYIHENLEGRIPQQVIEHLKAIPVGNVERAEGKFRTGGRAAGFFFNYLRMKQGQGLSKTILEFPTHMRRLWFLWKLRQLPAQAVREILKSARNSHRSNG